LPNDPTPLQPETIVTTAARGHRRRCTSCSAPFYDLQRDPIVCPKCGIELVPLLRQRRERPKPTPTGRAEEPAPVEAAEDDVDEDEEADTDADGESDDAPDEESDDESKSSEPDGRDRT
jgi:hypothetical protein